jgi:hypothetical protein
LAQYIGCLEVKIICIKTFYGSCQAILGDATSLGYFVSLKLNWFCSLVKLNHTFGTSSLFIVLFSPLPSPLTIHTFIVISSFICIERGGTKVYNFFVQVVLLESRDRLGGRIHTDYSFGFPVDLGASW